MDSSKSTNDEISLMNGSQSQGGVRRCRDTDSTTSSDSVKRIKLDHDNNNVAAQSIRLTDLDVISPEINVSSPESENCDPKNDFSISDLKAERRRFETETESETSDSSNGGFRETSASSEICLDSDEMESPPTLKKKPIASPATCKPVTVSENCLAAEIDEFFALAERKEQKRFADKYNYDIVKDVPTEGRYQWVRLKP
uniref:cyclin-dependent kinase inhibitor 7-like isoform X2 n=1 Tax=Erigeron canadensis TaxID=72917 RepID=UPI001CB909E6|nr:cyclin-dependent kinase inhibitor 7-like isoform X2 [Erigeron canadensis]